ncbi:MAG: TylF/MycF/NovP-related O-methyltransferase [bacterium]|nr:TylF/MycF/NovP-related O-methyltransferase [bacterium]
MTYQLGVLRDALFASEPRQRYVSRFRILNALLKRMGYRLYYNNVTWLTDTDFKQVWERFPARTRDILDRQYNLYSIAHSVAGVPGDTAECGAFRGMGSYLICAATQGQKLFEHHIFDSFEGLSEPDREDMAADSRAHQWEKHELSASLESVQRNLKDFDFIRYHKGWIPERFHEVADRRFSLVHIDVDLYQPTYDSLAFFYERMNPGGVILCDDYGSINCPGAKKACDDFIRDKPERSIIHLTTMQGMIIKQP